jgi:hypothetical protein
MDWQEGTNEYDMTTWTNELGDVITAVDQDDDRFIYDATSATKGLVGVFASKEYAAEALVDPVSMESADMAVMKFTERQAEDAAAAV